MRKILLIFAVSSAVFVSSCKGSGNVREPNVRDELVISGLSDSLWTYFSLETGKVVGQSGFKNAAQDSLWALRTDWDFAICGDFLRTNGGDSGKGFGGVQRIFNGTFQTLETAPEAGYQQDKFTYLK